MEEIDARGLSCPEPLMMTKATMDSIRSGAFKVLVDTAPPRDNILHLAERFGWTACIAEQPGGVFEITLTKD